MAWLSAASSSAAAAAATARAALLPPSPRGAVAAMQLLSLAGARLTAAATAAAAARTATAAARLLPSSAASAAAGPPSPGGPLSPARPGAAAAAFPSLLLTAAAAVPRHPLPLHQQQQQQQQSQRSLHAPSLFFRCCFPAAAAPPRTGNSLRFCSSSGSAAAGESSAQEKIVVVPSMGDSITEGSLGSWKKAVGDYVKEGEVVAVIDTDKVSVDVTSPAAGRLVHVFAAAAGDTVTVGKPLFTLDISAKAAEAAAATATPQQQQPAPHAKEGSSKPPPSPSPSSSSAEQQPPKPLPPPPSPHAAPPATASPPSHTKPAAPPAAAPAAAPAAGDLHASGERGEKRVAMTRMRQRIAERLKAAQNAAAMLTTFNEVDMGNLVALRSELNSAFQETHGVKMGFVSAFMLAASQAIRKVPEVNAYIDGKEIVYKNYVDISIAVATPAGLVVPVVRDCHRKTWAQLEKDLAALADRARKGQIALEDMAGGTFTISNGGVYGSMMGTPIINPPQSSILGMHAVTKRAVVKDDQIVIRPMMYLALTYDHRLIDGREAVTFLRLIREYIEDPRKMLLGL